MKKKKMSTKVREKIVQKRADVNIGKHGLSDSVLMEIKRRLKDEEVLKVRILRSCLKVTGLDRKTIAKKVAEIVNAELIAVRGYTFVLKRRSEGKEENIK